MPILTQNFRGTRTPNVAVQNTSGFPLICVSNQSTWDDVQVWSDASSSPTTQRWESQGAPIFTRGSSAVWIVQPNHYYKIGPVGTGSTPSVLEVAVGVGGIADSGNLGSRSLATNYQNTSGGAIIAVVQIVAAASAADLNGYSDSTTTPTTLVWNSHPLSSAPDSCALVVPNGHYYRVESSGSTIVGWREYTLPFNVTKADQTASRALGSAYQNSGSDGMFISVVRSGAGSSTGIRQFYADTSNPPTTLEFFQQTSSSGVSESWGIALPTWYYEATGSGGDSITKWWEYTIGSLAIGGKLLQCAQP